MEKILNSVTLQYEPTFRNLLHFGEKAVYTIFEKTDVIFLSSVTWI